MKRKFILCYLILLIHCSSEENIVIFTALHSFLSFNYLENSYITIIKKYKQQMISHISMFTQECINYYNPKNISSETYLPKAGIQVVFSDNSGYLCLLCVPNMCPCTEQLHPS